MSKSPSGYVLKFISGKYQGGEFPLEMDSEIIIGRSSELSMVLVEDMVSRQHSRITTHGSEIYIEDLGSTNGTFVNGEKITRKRIKEGDRILVGTSIIKLVAVGSEEDQKPAQDLQELAGEPQPTPDNLHAHTPLPNPGPTSTSPTGTNPAVTVSPTGPARPNRPTTIGMISGLIEELPLPDLLQLFSTSRKSGILAVEAKRGLRAEIYLRDGKAYYTLLSNAPGISPYKSFYRLLAWTHGTFSLEPANPASANFPEEIVESTEALLMEGMRQLDEIANLGQIPSMAQTLQICQPLHPPLRSLTPELLDTMQLVHNCGTVEAILNTSLASDLETLQDLVYLLQNNYIAAH